jgi:nitrogenase molybdenum-iron protein alpha/beta subunit
MGDLAWVQEVLAEMGATVLATLTHNTSLQELSQVAAAEACLVLSHDAGQRAADVLAERFGMAQWCKGLLLPIGLSHTRNWLNELGSCLGKERVARTLVERGEAQVITTCRRKGLQQSAMHRAPAAIVADATVGVPLVRFVTEDLEMVPELVCLRSGQAGVKEMLGRELEDLALAPRVLYDTDVYQAISAVAEVRPEMVLGSNVERHAVREMDIPYTFRLVNPVSRFRLTDRAYWGYTGVLNLIEIMQNEWWDRYRSKRRRYKARW